MAASAQQAILLGGEHVRLGSSKLGHTAGFVGALCNSTEPSR